MMDLLLYENDLAIEQGDISVCPTDTKTIAQTISIKLKILAGEWFLDENLGIPYFTDIFGQKCSKAFIRQVIMPELQAVPGVSHIKDLTIEQIGRSMMISFAAVTNDGTHIDIKNSIGI